MKIHNADVSGGIALPVLIALLIPLAACSRIQSMRSGTVFRIDEKALAGPLVYTILNVGRQTAVGNKFESLNTDAVLLTIRATNTSPDEPRMIPVLTLVDDDGRIYREMAPANASADWLGDRKLGPAQTKQGTITFQAPVRHYRLSLNTQISGKNVSIDVPVGAIAEGFSNASGTRTVNNIAPLFPHDAGTSLKNANPSGSSLSPDYPNTLGRDASLTDADAQSIH